MLPTYEVFRARNLKVQRICSFCGDSTETIMHLLKNCHFTKAIWFAIFEIRMNAWDVSSCDIFALTSRWAMHHRFKQPHFLLKFLLLLERIWKVRNEFNFQAKQFNCDQVVKGIKARVNVYVSVLRLVSPSITSAKNPVHF